MSKPAPPITADAVGITEAASKRTAGVVDQLIAPGVVATEATIVQIPTERIRNHPRNRKVTEADVEDLVAEFKAGEPILNPLGVTAAADWNAGKPDDLPEIPPGEYVITAGGHRRLLAAEVANVKTVPCIVRPDFAGAKGRRAALLENLHRQDLDPFEEAEAFSELVTDYKLGQRDLAGIVGCNQSHISKRLKLLKLPSKVRAAVTVGKMRISDAVELAAVADDKQLLDAALDKVKSWGWDAKRAVERVTQEAESAKAVAAEVERLTAQGVAILDRDPAYHYTTTMREPCRLDALGIKAAQHKKEPCHAARVRATYQGKAEVTYACKEPKRHAAKADSTVKATVKPSAGQTMSAQEREQRKLKQELKKNVQPARQSVLQQLVALGGFDAQTRRELITRSVIERLMGGYSSADSDLAIDLLGIRPATESRVYARAVLAEYAKTAKDDHLALLGAVVYFEGRLRDVSSWGHWTGVDRWFLELLERNGYVITDAERQKLGDTRNDDGTWSPAGVTAVDPDLCSACSDAQNAGWVDTGPDAAAPNERLATENELAEAVAG